MKKLLYILSVVAVAQLASCTNDDPKKPGYEYMGKTDMYRSPSYETYSSNPNFSDSMTMRKPVAGTISRGEFPYEASAVNDMPFAFANSKDGYEAAGLEAANPIALTPEVLEQGKVLYGKFCSHCHGTTGQGDGKTIAAGFPPPPSYSAGASSRGGAMKDLTAGKIFHTITYGVNMMGSHASQLNKEERWKIVFNRIV